MNIIANAVLFLAFVGFVVVPIVKAFAIEVEAANNKESKSNA